MIKQIPQKQFDNLTDDDLKALKSEYAKFFEGQGVVVSNENEPEEHPSER